MGGTFAEGISLFSSFAANASEIKPREGAGFTGNSGNLIRHGEKTAAAAGNCAELVESAGRRMAVMAEARADRQLKVIDGAL